MRKTLTIATTALLALSLAACGGGSDSSSSSSTPDQGDPATQDTVTQAAEVDDEPEPVTQAPAPAPAPDPIVSLSDYDDAMLLLGLTWDQQDYTARDDMCWGYRVLGEDWVVDELNSSSPEPINERAIRDHFAEVC